MGKGHTAYVAMTDGSKEAFFQGRVRRFLLPNIGTRAIRVSRATRVLFRWGLGVNRVTNSNSKPRTDIRHHILRELAQLGDLKSRMYHPTPSKLIH